MFSSDRLSPSPAHVVGAFVLGALAACGGASDGPSPGALRLERGAEPRAFERVVLVTLDTLRVDHVSCYGYPRATTPFLDSLAARGVRFTRAQAAISHTAPSHATMLSGLVPALHGVLQNGGRLAADTLAVPGLFAAAGYETAAFLNVRFLAGVARGFHHVGLHAVAPDGRILTGADVIGGAIAWLSSVRRSERFLLWVHLYDPHRWKELVLDEAENPAPLWGGASPPDFLERIAALHGLPVPSQGQPYRVAWTVEGEKRSLEHMDLGSVEGFRRCIDAYDTLTLFADQEVQRLHRALEALELPGRTLWIVTSDHGEGLASHGVAGHGGRIYQEQLHVPLIVHASDGSLGPGVVDELVGHVDLFPTLARVIGCELRGTPPHFEGRSLWPLLEGQAPGWGARTIFAQRRPPEDGAELEGELYALQDARHKLILQEPGADECYDLFEDPRESRDLGHEHAAARRLREELEERLRILGANHSGSGEEVPVEWLQELRDLGYVR
jgi:arylsulfatase A-like enzyme